MGWAIGYDGAWDRDIGYGVPAWCDQPGCAEKIDRGLSFVCGSQPYGGDRGCGLYFCAAHLAPVEPPDDPGTNLCERCRVLDDNGQVAGTPFAAKPDHPEWIAWKLTDESWAQWRETHPELVTAMGAS